MPGTSVMLSPTVTHARLVPHRFGMTSVADLALMRSPNADEIHGVGSASGSALYSGAVGNPNSAARNGAPPTAHPRTRAPIVRPRTSASPCDSRVLSPGPHPAAGPASTQYVKRPLPKDAVTPSSGVVYAAGSAAAEACTAASARPAC